MRTLGLRWLLLTSLVGALCTIPTGPTTAAFAQLVVPQQRPLVRLTGTLKPLEATSQGLDRLTVSLNGQEWRFVLEDVETLTYTTQPGWMILNDLFPPQLHLTGQSSTLQQLEAAQQAGTPVAAEGRLYVADHVFHVTRVIPG